MGCKLFVALQLEVAHHFIERCAGGRTRRFEPPATLGATKTPKTLLLNPYQLPAQGRLCHCAPFAVRPHAWYPLALEGRNVICHRAKFTSANLDGLSGILHTWKISCSCERPSSGLV